MRPIHFIHVQTLLQTIIVHVSQIVDSKAAHKIATVKAAKYNFFEPQFIIMPFLKQYFVSLVIIPF